MSEPIRQWVADQTGLVTIWAHANAERPPRPYVTINQLSRTKVGRANVGRPDGTGEVAVTGNRELSFSIQVIESSEQPDPRAAFEVAEALADSLDLPSVRADLSKQGWAFVRIESLNDVPQVVGTKWEPRATLDVVFRTAVEQSDNVGVVENVEITGDYGDDQQDEIIVEAD